MMNSTVHVDDYYDDDCDNDACEYDNDGFTDNHDIRYHLFDTITAAAAAAAAADDDDENGGIGCDNSGWH